MLEGTGPLTPTTAERRRRGCTRQTRTGRKRSERRYHVDALFSPDRVARWRRLYGLGKGTVDTLPEFQFIAAPCPALPPLPRLTQTPTGWGTFDRPVRLCYR